MTDQPTERVASELVERIDEQPWSFWLTDDEKTGIARFLQSELAAQQAAIVAWLRADADLTEVEAVRINKNTSGNPRKIAAEWAQMIAMKRGIATAIERGEHKEQG